MYLDQTEVKFGLSYSAILAVKFMRFLVNFYCNYFQGHETAVISQFSFVRPPGERNVNSFFCEISDFFLLLKHANE